MSIIFTLNAGVESLGRALKSKDSSRSTPLCGRNIGGNGELNVRPPSTTYSFLMWVGYISKIPSNWSEIVTSMVSLNVFGTSYSSYCAKRLWATVLAGVCFITMGKWTPDAASTVHLGPPKPFGSRYTQIFPGLQVASGYCCIWHIFSHSGCNCSHNSKWEITP